MALRKVLLEGDKTLRKKSREVDDINDRTRELIADLFDTMRDEDGLGLAAPQVGVLKKIFVMEKINDDEAMAFINPVIIKKEGEQVGVEGCLSLPGLYGIVKRPETVTVRAENENGEVFERTFTGLAARCCCHENDHLYGILYRDLAQGELRMVNTGEADDDSKHEVSDRE